MTKKVKIKHKSNKHSISNNINIHIHDHEKKKKKTKKKTTKKKSHIEGANFHYPLILPSNQTVMHPPQQYNYDNRPPQDPYKKFQEMLDVRLKKFETPQTASTDLSSMIGSHNARITIREDGSLHADSIARMAEPNEIITPEYVEPTPTNIDAKFDQEQHQPQTTSINSLLKEKPEDIQSATIDTFGDQIPENIIRPNPEEIRANYLDRTEKNTRRENMIHIASELYDTIQKNTSIENGYGLNASDWKNYRKVMDYVGHSVSNKKVKRETILSNMLKYKTEFEEHKLKEQQKEKEQQEENRAKYGPAKTTMQTLYDNAGSIAGGAGGVFSIGKTIYDVASSVKKATDLSPNTINNVANVATKVYKTAETVSDVSGLLSPSQKKRQKAREQLIKKAVSQTLSEVEKGYISSTEGYYKRGGGRYVESFSNQEVSNTGFSNN